MPRCHDCIISRRRLSDRIKSRVALDCAPGDAVLAYDVASSSNHLVAHSHSFVEIAVWALFFWWQQCLPDAESSFYFSGVTYATIGYGDLVLPKEWRLFGPVEGLTGILMCGLSTAFLFATLSRMYWARKHQN